MHVLICKQSWMLSRKRTAYAMSKYYAKKSTDTASLNKLRNKQFYLWYKNLCSGYQCQTTVLFRPCQSVAVINGNLWWYKIKLPGAEVLWVPTERINVTLSVAMKMKNIHPYWNVVPAGSPGLSSCFWDVTGTISKVMDSTVTGFKLVRVYVYFEYREF